MCLTPPRFIRGPDGGGGWGWRAVSWLYTRALPSVICNTDHSGLPTPSPHTSHTLWATVSTLPPASFLPSARHSSSPGVGSGHPPSFAPHTFHFNPLPPLPSPPPRSQALLHMGPTWRTHNQSLALHLCQLIESKSIPNCMTHPGGALVTHLLIWTMATPVLVRFPDKWVGEPDYTRTLLSIPSHSHHTGSYIAPLWHCRTIFPTMPSSNHLNSFLSNQVLCPSELKSALGGSFIRWECWLGAG